MKQFVFSLALLATAGSLVAGGFSVTEQKGKTVTVAYDGKPIVHLMTSDDRSTKEAAHANYKVYLHVNDMLDPKGAGTITKGAGDKFTHHRGIYIGWSKTRFGKNSYDTWHMKGEVRQVFRRLVDSKSTENKATFTAAIDWVDGDEILLSEERSFVVHRPNAKGAFLLDTVSKITAVKGDVDLNGDPEHAGSQFRAAAEVVKNTSAKYLFPSGKMDQKSVIAARGLPWAAMTFKANGNEYHVQHMSHPSLPKPIRYSAYRNYGRFGSFFVTKLKKGESRNFKVRYYLSPGAFPDDMLAASKKRFAEFAR